MSSTTTPGDALRAAVQPGSLRPKPRHDRRSRVPAHQGSSPACADQPDAQPVELSKMARKRVLQR